MAFYIKKNCPYCDDEGNLFVWRCGDGKSLAFSCDECSALWASIENIEIGSELKEVDLINNFMPSVNVPIYGPSAGWATMQDMINQGISDEVAGEGDWVETRK
ncbi:hypothetical protein [Acidovorax sp. BLS4]|uniref:hypothetical protein n=1 Tax=Acidovorax sp. BLS4 TaxID=3273430 RepID=UPI002942A676|nr:hypothetical protein [Paracidovorax avenae]WOI45054.1 hypothetical protein R1Z03_21430 [Paracidovorax avenae]